MVSITKHYIKFFIILLFVLVSGCSEFALLMSGSSVAISQNTYVKAYNSVDVLTIMNTDKSIKKYIYDETVLRFKESKK